MHTTRREILDDLLDFVGNPNDSGARDTAERILNRVLKSLWMQRAWRQFIAPNPYQISTVANTRAYALPGHFGRMSGIDGIIRNLTTGKRLTPIGVEALQDQNPKGGTALDTPGPPSQYAIGGTQPVARQPAAAGEALEVLSSSAADAAVRVLVSGINSDGVWDRREVTLTGQAPVAIGTWVDKVDGFSKAYPDGTDPTTEHTSSEGTVTLRVAPSGTVLGTLLPGESSREVQVLVLDPTPDAVYTIAVPFIRGIQRLYRDADPIPGNWEPAVFEAMEIEWQIQAGTLSRSAAAQMPKPALTDLICLENAAAAQEQRLRTPYTGS